MRMISDQIRLISFERPISALDSVGEQALFTQRLKAHEIIIIIIIKDHTFCHSPFPGLN